MSLSISKLSKPQSSNFVKAEPISAGTYVARLVQLITLGVQESEWQGETKKAAKVMLTFELPTETLHIDGQDKPRWVSKEYNLSLHEKSGLTPVVKALDPNNTAKDLTELVGKPCMVVIGKTSTGNHKITSVSPPMKGMPVSPIFDESKMVVFDFDNPDLEAFATFPQFMQDKIKAALNYKGFADNVPQKAAPQKQVVKQKAAPEVESPFDDDVPF